jgi:hypothetical protein
LAIIFRLLLAPGPAFKASAFEALLSIGVLIVLPRNISRPDH